MKKEFSPKISIIMVVRNEENTITKSIRSILNQNFSKFELLIFDNNSKDKTKFFLRNMSYKDKRIKVFYSKKNIGLTKGLNFLLKKTKSETIVRIDGDDYWNTNKLRLQFKFFNWTNKNVVGTNTYYLKKNKINSSSNLPLSDREIRKKIVFSNPFIHSSIVFNKKYMKSYDITFPKCQDYNAWLKLSLNKDLKFRNIYRKLTYHSLDKSLSPQSILDELRIRFKHLKHLGLAKFVISFFYIFYSILVLSYKFVIKKK